MPVPGSDPAPAAPAGDAPDGAALDAELVRRARADPEAFGLLYDRYVGQIYRYAHRRLRDREAAEDVTGEVFYKALRSLDGYQPQTAPFSAWLHRIAANAVVDHHRARREVVSLDADVDLERAEPDTWTGAVEDEAIDRVEAGRVWAAVGSLTDGQRTAVTLRLGHDLPIAEIARRMGRTEGAVKLLLNRGLAALRLRLEVSDGDGRPRT